MRIFDEVYFLLPNEWQKESDFFLTLLIINILNFQMQKRQDEKCDLLIELFQLSEDALFVEPWKRLEDAENPLRKKFKTLGLNLKNSR